MHFLIKKNSAFHLLKWLSCEAQHSSKDFCNACYIVLLPMYYNLRSLEKKYGVVTFVSSILFFLCQTDEISQVHTPRSSLQCKLNRYEFWFIIRVTYSIVFCFF